MKEFELKYGCNPNQKPAKIYMKDGSELPITILSLLQACEPHLRSRRHPTER